LGLLDLFTKKAKQKNPAYLETGTYQTPKWSTQKDEDYLRHAYNRVVWVYSCVSIIASNVSSVPWELYRVNKTNGNEKQLTDHPVLDILNGKVNANMTSKDFFDLWATYLATQGKFYAMLNNPIIPTQLYPLYGHKVKPIPSRDKFVSGFEYKISHETQNYKDKEVMWSKFNDPLDFYEGLSPIRAMARTIDTENEAVDWNKSQLQNQAVPPGAITVQNPSPEMQNKLRSEWLKRYGGAKNARVPLILNAEKASYTQFGLSSVDMDFIEQRKLSRIEICSGFGVPPQVVGDPEGQTYSNYQEADRAMWKNTIIPRYLEHMKDVLNLYIAKKYNESLEIRYCLDEVSSLQENINEIAERARQNFKFGIITQNEARKENGFEDSTSGDGDKYIYEIQGKLSTDEKPKEEEKAIKKKSILSEEEQERLYYKTEDERKKFYDITEKRVKKLFEIEKEKITAKNYEKVLEDNKENWQKALVKSYTETIKFFGNNSFNSVAKLKQSELFNVYDENIKKFVAETVGEKVELIEGTTTEGIKKLIQEGIDEGLSIVAITKNIKNLYENMSKNRAELIARTEIVSASNFGSLSGARQAEEQLNIKVNKIWIRTFDSRVRDAHARAGSHPPIALKDKFSVGGDLLEFPGDPNGSPENVIRCRCAIGYVRKEE